MKQLLRLISSCLLFCLATSSLQAQENDTLLTSHQLDSMHSYNVDYWGAITPGRGFQVVKTEYGTLNISGYMLFRYLNQLPATQTYYDHLGNQKETDGRNDIIWHRVQAFMTGWIYVPKLNYNITFWTVNATNQVAIAGNMSYRFHKYFNLSAGINSLGGTRSLQGSHPYWLGSDRVMADEYFRTGFTSAIWATGEPINTLHYFVTIGQNLSELGIAAGKFNRKLGYGASLYWLPTTDEFGPRGAYGDWEYHKKLATRFGSSFAHHREDRYNDLSQNSPDNTSIRISDGNLLFLSGALAPDVTIQEANYTLWSMDAGLKYKGLFLQAEYYRRTLDKFNADGPLPQHSIFDDGFMIQLAGFPIKKRLEVYCATSQIFGSFKNSNEYLLGLNVYPFKTRNVRLNCQVIFVEASPVSSVFGYYTGGQSGTTLSAFASILF
ncbi:hypothetical protein [Polluticoccus soli]|uniref:hypothetical protein n=1 Tax=Polluticoccus soli TaxID=3034150 RepID=UPI0023E2879D|nr:hypothetical protein [Flavipsychrobacter sp. JY13-12]